MSGIAQFWHQFTRELGQVWDVVQSWLLSVFDPQSGWEPKAIFGAGLLLIIFWIARRGTKTP